MKPIKYLFLLLFFFLSLVSFKANAYDYINWDELRVDAEYDYSNEELDLKVYLYDNSNPQDDYYAIFELDGREYIRDFNYNSSRDELYFEYSIDIDREDIEDRYDLDIEIINDSSNHFEYEDSLTFTIWDIFDIDDLKLDVDYNYSSEYLEIEFYVDDVNSRPSWIYTTYLEFNNRNYSKNFLYNSEDDKFYSIYRIYIDREDLEYSYSYNFKVKHSTSTIYNKNGRIYPDYYNDNNRYNDDDIDWSDVDVNNYYDERDEELKMTFYFKDVYNRPKDDYKVRLKIDWKYYTKSLTYNSSNNTLYTSIDARINDRYIKDYYNLSFDIINQDNNHTEYSKSNLRIEVDENFYYNDYDRDVRWWYYEDDIDWDNNKVNTTYDRDYNNLHINFSFNDINYNPRNTYYIKLNFSGKKITKKLEYSSSLDRLVWDFYINISEWDLKSYYYVSYSVVNSYEDFVEYAKPIFKISVYDEYDNRVDTSSNNNFSLSLKDSVVDSIIKKAPSDKNSKIKFLEKIILQLNTYSSLNPRYKNFLTDVISDLRKEINNLKWNSWSYNSDSLFPMFDL